jgi:protein TonB
VFERALLTKGRTRTPLGVVVGIASELSAIGLAILVPLVYTDQLPGFMMAPTPIAVPTRAPDPPPQEVIKVARASGAKVMKVALTNALIAPTRIPTKVNDNIIEVPEITGSGPWVPGATGSPTLGAVGLPATAGVSAAPPPPPEKPVVKQVAEKPIERLKLGGRVQDAKVVSRIIPVYPPLAKQARVQGTVTLVAVIGIDGRVKSLRATSGHPLLVPAALEAVRQWVYRPTTLNGDPVEVESPIDVHFTLGQ